MFLLPVHPLTLGQKLYFYLENFVLLQTLLKTFSDSVEVSYEKVKRERIK